MTTRILMNGAIFDVIANFDSTVERWQRCVAKRTFMPLRHAGRNLLLNPQQIILMTNAWT